MSFEWLVANCQIQVALQSLPERVVLEKFSTNLRKEIVFVLDSFLHLWYSDLVDHSLATALPVDRSLSDVNIPHTDLGFRYCMTGIYVISC